MIWCDRCGLRPEDEFETRLAEGASFAGCAVKYRKHKGRRCNWRTIIPTSRRIVPAKKQLAR